MEEATAFYVEISKAYKALTDEEIRNNYLQYGHPDGKQSFSIGIALPKFIIEEGSGKYVLLVYGVLLGVLLPYIVGTWWYGTQRVTREKVYVNTAANLFQQYANDITKGGVVSAVTSGDEYNEVLKGNKAEQGLGKVEKAIMAGDEGTETVAGLAKRDVQKINSLEGVRRKTCALLWAYLGRVKLIDQALDDGEAYDIQRWGTLTSVRKVRYRTYSTRPQRRIRIYLPCLFSCQSSPQDLLHISTHHPSHNARILSASSTAPFHPFHRPCHRR